MLVTNGLARPVVWELVAEVVVVALTTPLLGEANPATIYSSDL